MELLCVGFQKVKGRDEVSNLTWSDFKDSASAAVDWEYNRKILVRACYLSTLIAVHV